MSNKRNTTLTNAAFYAVLLFCLLGVGAGAYLLLFPGASASSGVQTPLTDLTESPAQPSPVTEIIHPVTVPELPEVTEPLAEKPQPAESAQAEPVQIEPTQAEAVPTDDLLIFILNSSVSTIHPVKKIR